MSFEIVLTPCKLCKRVFGKKTYESYNRRAGRAYCTIKCAKDDFRTNEIGWFAHGSMAVNKDKTLDEIAPRIWSDEQFKQFEESYPELSSFA